MFEEELKSKLIEAMRQAACVLPDNTIRALRNAEEKESNKEAIVQLQAILETVRISRTKSVPMCQDTGIQNFLLEVGYDFPMISKLKRDLFVEATREATPEIPIRPNTVNPFTGKNPEDNTGRFTPVVLWDFVEGNDATINILPKGGGSENMCTLKMMVPGEGFKGLKKFIVDHVIKCGGKPCPPTILGIGIGGGADMAMKLGKKALLRDIGERHEDPAVAQLEEELLELVNRTGIGPMGVGGDTTCLDVHVEYAHRHPASFPIGIMMQCWCDRRIKVTIDKDRRIQVV